MLQTFLSNSSRSIFCIQCRIDLLMVPLPEIPGSPVRHCLDTVRAFDLVGYRPILGLKDRAQLKYKWHSDHVSLGGGVSAK